MREYGSAPDVTIYSEPGMQFAYVPSHLHHMVFELVKNSLRAVEDRFQHSDQASPPIRLVIAEGGEDVTIKVGATQQVADTVMCVVPGNCVYFGCYDWFLL